jgi:hypothetical protein
LWNVSLVREKLGDAKIGQLGLAGLSQEHVLRLDVAMNQPCGVRVA